MPFLTVDDTNLYYEVHGASADRPAIVFAHGAGGNHLSWWQQVPYFMSRYTCVIFDHRGLGRSVEEEDGRGGAAFVDDLRTLLDHLGVERTTLVAQSMGGWTCLGFAVRYPKRVQRLMMCDTHGGLRTPEIDGLWRDALREMTPPGEIHPAAGRRMYDEQPSLHFLYTEIAALNMGQPGAFLRTAPSTTVEQARALTMPVLFIAGDEDIVIPPAIVDLAAAALPNARIEHVPAAGHSVYFERAAQFNAILDRFLARDSSVP